MLELNEYRIYTKPAELEKATHTLYGIVEGIVANSIISSDEIAELVNWCSLHKHLSDRHPFSEILPIVERAIFDNVITDDEIQDILWVCSRTSKSSPYYDLVSSSMQELFGVIHGLLADCILSTDEILGFSNWVQQNRQLAGTYPYSEIEGLLISILQDGKISDDERNMLLAFLGNFVDTSASLNINCNKLHELREQYSVSGICTNCPDLQIRDKRFCFTGDSYKATRDEIAATIFDHGGTFINSVSKKLDYLVIGNAGNPCWAFSCYGRKVEKALALRQQGCKTMIISENDFWDALQD